MTVVSIFVDGQFSKSAIVDFVFANKLPLVTTFTMETAPEIFENPIKKQVGPTCMLNVITFISVYFLIWILFFYQLLLFAISNDTNKVMPAFQEDAKLFKGKVRANISNLQSL